MSEDPKEHVIRGCLPWRPLEPLTECGLDANQFPSLSLDQMVAKVKRQGKQRAAMSSCMSCWNAAERWRREDQTEDLLSLVDREISRVRWNDVPARQRLVVELQGIVALIEAHRDEFDRYIADRAETTDLSEARARRAARR